jgi:hypothetical protein
MAATTTTTKQAVAAKQPRNAAHTAALTAALRERNIIHRYLTALRGHTPTPGRQRSITDINARIDAIDAKLPAADPITRLHLTQERLNLEKSATRRPQPVADLSRLENDFIAVAATYSTRKGISYAAWRHVGVPASTLTRAGISRTR